MSKEDFDKAMQEVSEYAQRLADDIKANSHLTQLASDIKTLLESDK